MIFKKVPPGKKTLRVAMYKVFEGKCFYTDEKLEPDSFTIDHIHARACGGEDIVENYALCSPEHNRYMGSDYDPREIQPYLQIVRDYFAPRVRQEMRRLRDLQKEEWREAYREIKSKRLTECAVSSPDTLAQGERKVMPEEAARLLMFTAIPYRKWLKPQTESRRLGPVKVSYCAAEDAEAPSEIYARLILAWICQKARQKSTSTIDIGDSLEHFAGDLGLTGRSSSFPEDKLRRNVYSLSHSELLIETAARIERIKIIKTPVVIEAGSQLQLSDRFYEIISDASLGEHLNVLRSMRPSPLIFDLYAWVEWCARNRLLPIEISWEHLRMLFGTQRQGIANFATYVRHKLSWLALDLEISSSGLVAHEPPPSHYL